MFTCFQAPCLFEACKVLLLLQKSDNFIVENSVLKRLFIVFLVAFKFLKIWKKMISLNLVLTDGFLLSHQ